MLKLLMLRRLLRPSGFNDALNACMQHQSIDRTYGGGGTGNSKTDYVTRLRLVVNRRLVHVDVYLNAIHLYFLFSDAVTG